ncbi:MAG: S41 family peptidase [Candidatus Melainabacteria bacterium]|nr:S41 family peptidase [Candidatus Melainabacteria bacterium]
MKFKLNIKTLLKANLIMLFIFCLAVCSNFLAKNAKAGIEANFAFVTEEAENKNIDPDDLYAKVWDLIKRDYVDQAFNGQDWNIWKERYKGKLKTQDDAHKAIETMLVSLGDRYTRFLSKKDFEDEKQAINAKLSGIGIQIGLDKSQRLIVIAPIEGTPAAKAGLMPSDEIIEINGNSTKGISVEEAANQIKGPVGTQVTLTIARGKDTLKRIITRAEIPIKAIAKGHAKIIKNNLGYIRLNSFISQEATKEMKEALKELTKAHGLIIDLRDNPGGLLTNAIEISDIFLEDGVIVSTVDRDGYIQSVTADKRILTDKPIVVLVNENSASASEILSGALKDNQRATIVGSKTFGKGLVQGINKLDDGSGVNITIAKYLTPAKVDINQLGIQPDIEVKLSIDDYKASKGPWFSDPNQLPSKRKPDDGKDVQLVKGIETLKEMIKVVENQEGPSSSKTKKAKASL